MMNEVRLKRILAYSSLLSLSFALAACGSDESDEKGAVGDTCALESSECDSGLSCDPLVSGDGYVCATPVTLKGVVTDALTGDTLASSRVVVLSAEGAPVGDVVYTGEDGAYSVAVSAPRNPDGSLAQDAKWTLTVSAQGYEVFPAGPRPAVPIAATQATAGEDEGSRVIDAANTQVGLLPLSNPESFGRQISGSISADAPGGTLVVAEGALVPAPYAIASRTGEFTIYNVPDGSFELVGYKRGQQLTPSAVDVSNDSREGVVIESSDVTLGGVSGNVNIVNAPGGSLTSVVLVPQSVFDTRLERGPIPLGLRAPGAPSAPSINGAFDFDDVPLGDYVVLAAFENDALVRDPDSSIGGTSLQTVNVTSGESVVMSESFKITEHLAIVGPGADTPEAVGAPVTFSWADDSSEDRYELELYTALGDLVWEDRAINGVSGSANVDLAYSGPALVPGMVYQFRVTSFRDGQGEPTAISRSEDLRGVFEFQQ
jgi:hypothetical protein